MNDPVVAADGRTYNRADIERWLKQHETSPLTNEPLEHKMLIPNMAVRRQINTWRLQYGLPVLSPPAKAKPKSDDGSPPGPRVGAFLKTLPTPLCAFSNKPLQAYCVTCRKSICSDCAIDSQRCKSHTTRPLDAIVSGIRDSHAAWVQALEGRPQQLQAEYDRIDAAAAAAGDAAIQAILAEVAELKQKLQRACVGDLQGVIREQALLLADVQLAAALPNAAVADSEESRCLLAAATRAPRQPPRGARGGRFQAAAAEAVSLVRLGCIVVDCGVGGVSAAGAGFLRAFGPVLQTSDVISPAQPVLPAPVQQNQNMFAQIMQNRQMPQLQQQQMQQLSLSSLYQVEQRVSSPAQPARVQHNQRKQNMIAKMMQNCEMPQLQQQHMQQPSCCAFDDEGNLAVSDCGNHLILVLRFSDGALLRTIGSPGSGNGQFQSPSGIAFDMAGHILVAEEGNNRVQMLRYSDGLHVRTIGGAGFGPGRGNFQFGGVSSIACDGSGHFAVFDSGNARVEVFRLSDGAHVRSIRHEQFNGGPLSNRVQDFDERQQILRVGGVRGAFAFDADSNLVFGCNDSPVIQVLRFSDGQSIRTIDISQASIACPQSLPPGWLERRDSSGRLYYVSPSGQTQWDPPQPVQQQAQFMPSPFVPMMPSPLASHQLACSCSRISFDGAGLILVADQGRHCVLVLRYADGAHVRTIGSYGQQEGLLNSPGGVAVDADGLVAVCDRGNNRVQVFE
jgi:hypothetical protein